MPRLHLKLSAAGVSGGTVGRRWDNSGTLSSGGTGECRIRERTARNVADSDGTLVISKESFSAEHVKRLDGCVEMGKPYLVIDGDGLSMEDATALGVARFVCDLSSRARPGTSPNTTTQRDVREVPRPSRTGVVCAARERRCERGRSTGQSMARRSQNCATNCAGILRPLSGQTTPLNTVRHSHAATPEHGHEAKQKFNVRKIAAGRGAAF